MPVPTISPVTSIIAYGVGVYFDFQPAASNSPTSWVITGLPDGMSADGVTGLCQGAPTTIGIYDVSFIAHNATGDSAAVVIPMVIEAGAGLLDPAILLDFDLETARITSPSVKPAKPGDPIAFAKTGDKVLVALGFVRDKFLVPQQIASVILSLKALEPETLIDLSSGIFDIVWTDLGPRYMILVDLTAATAPLLLGSVGEAEDDADTALNMVAQLRAVFLAETYEGDAHATALLTSDGTNPANNDTVTIAGRTYTFKTTLTGAANEVKIGATAAITLGNLKAAVNGAAGAGTLYGTSTVAHATVTATTNTDTTQEFTAQAAGTAGNAYASTESSAHLSFEGSTFAGGAPTSLPRSSQNFGFRISRNLQPEA